MGIGDILEDFNVDPEPDTWRCPNCDTLYYDPEYEDCDDCPGVNLVPVHDTKDTD